MSDIIISEAAGWSHVKTLIETNCWAGRGICRELDNLPASDEIRGAMSARLHKHRPEITYEHGGYFWEPGLAAPRVALCDILKHEALAAAHTETQPQELPTAGLQEPSYVEAISPTRLELPEVGQRVVIPFVFSVPTAGRVMVSFPISRVEAAYTDTSFEVRLDLGNRAALIDDTPSHMEHVAAAVVRIVKRPDSVFWTIRSVF